MKVVHSMLLVPMAMMLIACGGNFSGSGSCQGGSSSGVACQGEMRYTRPFVDPNEPVLRLGDAGFRTAGFDAGMLAVSLAQSSVDVISTSGYAVVTLELDSSQVVSQTFAWSRQGTVLLPSDAGAINAWLANYDGQIVDAVVSITGLQATNPTGANSFVAEAQYMGQVQGGFAYGWYNNGGGGCTDCVIK